jgi:hypothetical protein
MHANGYDGFNDLYRPGGIHEAACMAMFAAGSTTSTAPKARPSPAGQSGASRSSTLSNRGRVDRSRSPH